MDKEIIIHELIDEAMKSKDKRISVFIGASGTTVNVEPYTEPIDPQWIDTGNSLGRRFKCSSCGMTFHEMSPYCPACGEKMKML